MTHSLSVSDNHVYYNLIFLEAVCRNLITLKPSNFSLLYEHTDWRKLMIDFKTQPSETAPSM